MKREHFHVLVRHRIYLLGQLDFMEQRQFDCNKCNFIFEKLNTFHTQMKIQHCLALAGLDNWHSITLLGQLFWGKQKQFNFNKFIFTFLISNRFNTHEEATLPYPWTTQHHLIRQLYGGSNQHETHAIYGNKCNSIFVEINTICTHMKRQHFLALGGHRITILGQLFWESQLH